MKMSVMLVTKGPIGNKSLLDLALSPEQCQAIAWTREDLIHQQI